MIIITMVIHSAITYLLIHLNNSKSITWISRLRNYNLVWLTIIAIIIFCTTVIESMIWAMSYLYVGAIGSLEKALYFSIVTFSTLGYGDIILSDQWRLLSSIQAVNGIIILGWSTAILITTVQNLHKKWKTKDNSIGEKQMLN